MYFDFHDKINDYVNHRLKNNKVSTHFNMESCFDILSQYIFCRLETIDGSATAGEDYVPVKQTLVFKPEQTYIEYVVEIIDDNVYEPDETFFVKMALEPDQDAIMGKKSINMITIINDDGECPCRCSKNCLIF